jgi:hypothetical protein
MANLLCYRYHAWEDWDYDEEDIWAFVQRHGGNISIRADCIDFWIPRDYAVMFAMAFAELVRQPDMDIIL